MQHKTDENARDYEIKKAVYSGEYYQYFNVNEFDYKVHSYEYVTTDIFRSAVSMVVDLVKIGQMEVDFGDDDLNAKIKEIRSKSNFYQRLEKMVENAKIYGSSYVQLASEGDDVVIYNISPSIVHAEYNKANPQAEPEEYYTLIVKEINEKEYTLKTSFTDEYVIYTAYLDYGTDDEKPIDPVTIFEIPEEATRVDDFTLEIETNLEYSIFQGIQYNVKDDEFYGQGDLSMPIISKLNYYNRLINLCDFIFTYNAFPKFQGSDEVMKLIEQAKAETMANPTENLTTPTTFMSETPRVNAFLSSASYAFTKAFKLMRDKLYIFPAGRAGGDNKYIINEYNMNYLFDERDKIKQELYDELYISKMFYDQDVATGNISGIAMMRLMQKTINHVEDIQSLLETPLQRLFYNIANSLYNYSGDLPTIKWAGITTVDIASQIDSLVKADGIQNSYIKAEALDLLLDDSKKDIEEGLAPAQSILTEDRAVNANMITVRNSLRDRITQSVNGGQAN